MSCHALCAEQSILTPPQSVELNTQWQTLLREREVERRDAKLVTFRKRLAGRLTLREEQHAHLLQATLQHLERMEEIKNKGLRELAAVREGFTDAKHETDTANLKLGA